MKRIWSFICVAMCALSLGACMSQSEEESCAEIDSYEETSVEQVKVGDFVEFGTYEQDNNIENGKEAIEWRVLETKNNQALVLCNFGLECKPYHVYSNKGIWMWEPPDVTWEKCTIRQWLNNEFYNEAFSEEEKARIVTTDVSADSNPDYDTPPGNVTQDKVFLLSITELCSYFWQKWETHGHYSNRDCECMITEYANENASFSGQGESWAPRAWWLRSPGHQGSNAAYVANDGGVMVNGTYVEDESIVVRPVMWIELEYCIDKEPLFEDNSGLSRYIGQTLGDVKRDFGEYLGCMEYDNLTSIEYAGADYVFRVSGLWDSSLGNYPPDTEKIIRVSGYGKTNILDGLCGNMSYQEICATVGDKISLPEPEKMERIYSGDYPDSYTLYFQYENYNVVYFWKQTTPDNDAYSVEVYE